jgi:hypothetical protein
MINFAIHFDVGQQAFAKAAFFVLPNGRLIIGFVCILPDVHTSFAIAIVRNCQTRGKAKYQTADCQQTGQKHVSRCTYFHFALPCLRTVVSDNADNAILLFCQLQKTGVDCLSLGRFFAIAPTEDTPTTENGKFSLSRKKRICKAIVRIFLCFVKKSFVFSIF